MPLNDESAPVVAETQESASKPKAKTGRPLGATKLKISDEIVKQIESLARIQCTMKEAGAVLGVNEVTFSRFLQAHQKAMEAWNNGKETGKASLRRNQFKMAESNATMAIWLGKQCLGQTDKIDGNFNIAVTQEQMVSEMEAITGAVMIQHDGNGDLN
jgi:hypothetical protein